MHDNAQCPNIYTLRVFLVQCNLRRHVHHSAHVVVVRCLRLVSKSEVDYFNFWVVQVNCALVHQNIRHFQISMDDALVVDVGDGVDDFSHDPRCFDVRELFVLFGFLLD